MATRKPAQDVNANVAVAVRKATGTEKQKGDSLIADPKLRKAYREAMKRAAMKRAAKK